MAVVTLQTLWLNSAANPQDAMSFPLMASLSVTTARKGEVRAYSAGRLRSVVQAGRSRTVSAGLPALTREQIAWLEAHVADVLCARDDRGRKLWVVYYQLPIEEHQYNEEGNASLDLAEVSYSEAV